MRRSEPLRRKVFTSKVIAIVLLGISGFLSPAGSQAAQQSSPPTSAQVGNPAKPVGTIKAISGNSIQLSTDTGTEVNVTVQTSAKILRIAPGQKDLKDAAPITLQDLQSGDRILVRGSLGDDGKTVLATSVIAITKTDLAAKQARDREEWQRHGVGGLVGSVDAGSGTITISIAALGDKKNVAVHVSKDTVLRRYAPDSVKFDDAKPAPLDQVKVGDQLRARGTRSADGNELSADEVVSGTFRNISGTISSIDSAAGTIALQDLAAKKSVTLKITPDSQLRKLPLPIAQRIAFRLKGESVGGAPSASPGNATPPANAANAAGGPPAGARPYGASGQGGQGGFGGMGPGGPGAGRGGGDLQQAISRMPAATLADLQKGDAVMIVATEGTQGVGSTVITLLGGVEPILEASPKGGASTILSPWSLSNAPGGEGATP